ncbi:hypothetical protein RND71_034859 [Anisodus tanguticus]|uniref:Uncharacterized protein n=1 Tax=Anisodus tanguticus TaxID=243964 RepID=A0AAE1R400_9SOLA|nr:hypothetical protein RND71_034859 [Anisodus tanguticus]
MCCVSLPQALSLLVLYLRIWLRRHGILCSLIFFRRLLHSFTKWFHRSTSTLNLAQLGQFDYWWLYQSPRVYPLHLPMKIRFSYQRGNKTEGNNQMEQQLVDGTCSSETQPIMGLDEINARANKESKDKKMLSCGEATATSHKQARERK